MKRTKRILALLCAAVFSLALLAGCCASDGFGGIGGPVDDTTQQAAAQVEAALKSLGIDAARGSIPSSISSMEGALRYANQSLDSAANKLAGAILKCDQDYSVTPAKASVTLEQIRVLTEDDLPDISAFSLKIYLDTIPFMNLSGKAITLAFQQDSSKLANNVDLKATSAVYDLKYIGDGTWLLYLKMSLDAAIYGKFS